MKKKTLSEDSAEWIEAANLDPRNNSSVREWLEMEFAFPTNLYSSTFSRKNSAKI